jgi:DNA repair protein RadC
MSDNSSVTVYQGDQKRRPTKGNRPNRLRETGATDTSLTFTVRDLPESERPANRLRQHGPGALSTTELLAIILGNGRQLQDAIELMVYYDDLTGLRRSTVQELEQLPNIGPSTAARIIAALELGVRLGSGPRNELPQVRQPADAANLVMAEMSLLEQEHLRVLVLDTKNRVLASPTVYIGSVNTSVIRIGEMLRDAVRINAPAVIIIHNHPSGDPSPSPEDVAVTKQIVEAGKLLDIDVLDHLVIGNGRFVSLRERGLGFA